MTEAEAEIAGRIAALIGERLNLPVPSQQTDLIDTGLLDSLALVMLIGSLEEMFACELPLDDFDIDRFRSVESITEFLSSTGVLHASGS